MKNVFVACFVICAFESAVFAGEANPAIEKARAPRTREFKFNYAAKLKALPSGSRLRVWLPVPQTDEAQTIGRSTFEAPSRVHLDTEQVHGNKMAYFEVIAGASGTIEFQSSYDVKRSEVRALDATRKAKNVGKLSDREHRLYLSANKRVPIDGKPISLLEQLTFTADTVEVARKLYDRVDSHVKYDKSNPGYGYGDVLWVCDSQFGNCTDFHSLFISFARSKEIPAKFEIGFPLPPDRGEGKIGGYHCWGQFYARDYGWVPVDISEADKHPELKNYYFGNISENRIRFSTGRDINLVPKQAGPPLNYFVYPYAEVDGEPVSKDHMEVEFSYVDQS